MFEISSHAPVLNRGAQASSDPRDDVLVKVLNANPLPTIEFIVRKAYPLLIVTEVAAVEEEEQLVAFALVGCPIDGHEALGWAVEAELFADLSAAGGCGDSPRST